ncbi:predicted protein [Micromonas commoda]|uniref:Beta-lactamase-related domain-containing protein n=1 Tax=Micromonas commoda (strain RCC299 / NOUM17 / CCMP2709) TaxID=296587 RepID=C1EBH6_MICCC|nr:predicted protein [Micromonas commoda]ACO65725.1 predicted protein [Micromonas commoda]|eukprot:XP_002504467.1 predicted protein [Micromonas commoda]
MPADDAPAADDARAEPNAPPRRRLKREFDEHWLERCLGAPVERLLRQRRIVGACVCVVKVPMDGAPGETTDAGVVREYIRTYGYASLDPPGGAGSDASGRTNATRRTDVAWSTDPHSPRARLANNYGAVVDPRTTLFDVGSCAKIFPAVAIARLRDDLGVPELTQDADDHLPPELALASKHQTPNTKRAVTVGDLLRHTSGLVDVPGCAATTKPTTTVAKAKAKTGVVAAWPPGLNRAECDRNVALAAAVVERVSGHESYESYVLNELRVGVKDAVRGGRPSSFRNAYAALAEAAAKPAAGPKTKTGEVVVGECAFGDGVRAGRYVTDVTDAGDGTRALVRRAASRRADAADEGNESAGDSSVTPLWLTAWEMRAIVAGLLTPNGTLVRTEASVRDLIGPDVAFRWHGVDGAFEAYGSGFVAETTASGLRRRPTRRFDSAGAQLCTGAQPSTRGCTAVYVSSDDSTGADSLLALFPEHGIGVWIASNTREEWCRCGGGGGGGGGLGEVWDKPPAAGLVDPARSDGAQHALKMRSGPGEGPGGQPRFAELVLSRFVDDFIPAPGDEGGDSPR